MQYEESNQQYHQRKKKKQETGNNNCLKVQQVMHMSQVPCATVERIIV